MRLGERILVAGTSGSGKTALAGRLGLPRHELDALHHGPGWAPRPTFVEEVAAFAATDRWTCEDQYSRIFGELLWERADAVVWLDLPRRQVMRQVIGRSVHRAVTRTELWNGNREDWRAWLDLDHPIRWSWTHHAAHRAAVAERIARHPHLVVVRLRSAREARRFSGS